MQQPPYEVKHPIIIPKNEHVTILLSTALPPRQPDTALPLRITHNVIRQAGYWVINGRSAISSAVPRVENCEAVNATENGRTA